MPEHDLDKIIQHAVFDPNNCDPDDMKFIMKKCNALTLSSYITPYETYIKKTASTWGFPMTRQVALYINLAEGDELSIIIIPHNPKSIKPTKEQLDSLYSLYDHYFWFTGTTKLSDFDFEDVGKKYHIPLRSKITVIGTSYAIFIAPDIAKQIYGLDLGDKVRLMIRKVSSCPFKKKP
jgi:hypothetical protein